MTFAGKTVRFWLSPAGRRELKTALPAGESIEALVVDEDHLGAWIAVATDGQQTTERSGEVMLLKWTHFSTALTSFEIAAPTERPSAGFKP